MCSPPVGTEPYECAPFNDSFTQLRSTEPQTRAFRWNTKERNMKIAIANPLKLASVLGLLLLFSAAAFAQKAEISAAYAYVSGNGGLNGFDAGVAVFLSPRLSLAADYDGVYDTSQIGIFQITPVGQIVSKNHLQDMLMGPRVFLPGILKRKELTRLTPFVEVQLGSSQLNSEIISRSTGTRTGSSDTAFSWMIGGGGDFGVSSHLVGRVKLDLLRTHFADAGQARFRLALGFAYQFGKKH